MQLDVVRQAWNPSSQEAGAGALEIEVILSHLVNLRPAWATETAMKQLPGYLLLLSFPFFISRVDS